MTNRFPIAGTEDEEVQLHTYVAGVMFENHDIAALKLQLGEGLSLMREPDNAHDVNAVRIVRHEDQEIGFLPRQMAAWLAPFIDAHQAHLMATVTELQLQPETLQVRVQIEFKIPQAWVELSSNEGQCEQRPFEYSIGNSANGTYLLTNCSMDQLQVARDILQANGFEILRDGYCIRPDENGNFYEWYLKLSTTPLPEPRIDQIRTLLKKRMGVVSDPEKRNTLVELRETYQREVTLLRSKLEQALAEQRSAHEQSTKAALDNQARIEQLQAEIERYESQLKSLRWKAETSTAALQTRTLRQSAISAEVMDVFLDIVAQALTPRQSLEVISRLFAERIVVLPSALKAADESASFHERAKLFELLWKLVNDYWCQLASGAGDIEARKVFGNSFAATESEVTESNGKALACHTFTYQGKPMVMMKHLRIGVKHSVQETIRVHFEWLADEQKIVVGHCGPHLSLR